MKLKYTLLSFLLLGFTACSDSDDNDTSVNVADGTYSAECDDTTANGNDSSEINSIIFSTTEDGVRQRATRTDTYDDTACAGTEVLGTPSTPLDVTFADYGFGNGVSYYSGATNSTPYHLAGGVLYEGASVASDSITEEEGKTSADVFSAFIEAPATGEGYTLQESE